MRGLSRVVLVMALTGLTIGSVFAGPLVEEIDLVVRAAKQELQPQELVELKQALHPLLEQIADQHTFGVIQMFARLPQEQMDVLLDKGYLKWKYTDLDTDDQAVYADVVRMTTDEFFRQGLPPQPGFSVEELPKAEVGFTVLSVEPLGQECISMFILWQEVVPPTWVTVVNSRVVGTPDYFRVHKAQLSALKAEPFSQE